MRNNPSVSDLLRQIDGSKANLPSTEQMFEPAANIFYSILQMYNRFKKQNETQILQNKIYSLKISDSQNTMMQQQNNQYSKVNKKQVTIKSLCNLHRHMGIIGVENLLKMKQYLPDSLKKDLINEIVSQINDIEDIANTHLQTIFKVFKSIMKSDSYFRDCDGSFRKSIQSQLIEIILKANISSQQDFNQIAIFLMGLPNLDENILVLIAKLYKKITNNQQFDQLEKVYWYVSNKLDAKEEITIEISRIKLETMMAITVPKHLNFIKQELSNGITPVTKQIIIQECRNKMNENFTIHTNKIENIIDFIFMAIQLQNELWVDFLIWFWKLPEICKQYVSNNKLPHLVESVMSKPVSQIIKILELLNQNQNQYEISMYFVTYIMNNRSKFLVNKKIRKCLAAKIVIDPIYRFWYVITRQNKYIDLMEEIIELKQAKTFLLHVLEESPQKLYGLQGYLVRMCEQAPAKFRDFYIKVDSGVNSHIFGLKDNYLIHFLERVSDVQLLLSILKAIGEYKPSQYCIVILSKILKATDQSRKEFKFIKNQIIRTLNTILCSNAYSDLNEAFKIHMKQLTKNWGADAKSVFSGIPDQMMNSLTQFYKERPN